MRELLDDLAKIFIQPLFITSQIPAAHLRLRLSLPAWACQSPWFSLPHFSGKTVSKTGKNSSCFSAGGCRPSFSLCSWRHIMLSVS